MARACSNGRPGSPVKCTGSWLSNNGIDDPESYKSDYVNDGSLFDIYRDTSNNNALGLEINQVQFGFHVFNLRGKI